LLPERPRRPPEELPKTTTGSTYNRIPDDVIGKPALMTELGRAGLAGLAAGAAKKATRGAAKTATDSTGPLAAGGQGPPPIKAGAPTPTNGCT
jgi:hypothetical protein